jgi:hypothetical protein
MLVKLWRRGAIFGGRTVARARRRIDVPKEALIGARQTGFSRLLSFLLNVDSVAHRRHDDSRRNAPPLTPPSKGGERVRNECGGKQALVTMNVFIGPGRGSFRASSIHAFGTGSAGARTPGILIDRHSKVPDERSDAMTEQFCGELR